MIFEKHSVHLNRLESFYLMPFASCLPTQIISGLKYYSYRTRENITNQRFIYYYLKSNEDYIKQFAIGTATTTITKESVRNLEISLPPPSHTTKNRLYPLQLRRLNRKQHKTHQNIRRNGANSLQ